MAEYQDASTMSMDLNKAFDDSKYSECARQFKYKTYPIFEVLHNSNYKKAGSQAEGTDMWGSDLDLLIIDKTGVKVGYDPQKASTDADEPYLYLTRGPAGYTKLQVYLNGNNCENIENTIVQSFFKCEIERYDSKTILLTNHKLIDKSDPVSVTDHGPAQTVLASKYETIDMVLAYESKVVPNEMKSWFERTRRWLSKTTCDLFKSMGCCYVGVGNSKSPEQEFEWRISPTRQELYLMLNLNPTQFRCYILLKLIKKSIHNHCGDSISSYHCKTALFWTIETTENNIWQPQNLIECFLQCLIQLSVWVTEKKCPNYFIPEENMFESKVMNEIYIETLKHVIMNYFEFCREYFLPAIKRSRQTMDVIIDSLILLKIELPQALYTASSITAQPFYTFMQYNELIKTKPGDACIQKYQEWVCPHTIDINTLLEMVNNKCCCLYRLYNQKKILESNTVTEKDFTAPLDDPSVKSDIDHEHCLKLACIAAARGAHNTCDVLLQNVHRMARLNVTCECYISFQRDKTKLKRLCNLKDLVKNNISQNIRLNGQFTNKLLLSEILQLFSFCLQFRDYEIKAGMVLPPLHFEAHKTVGIPSEMILITMTQMKYDNSAVDLVSIHPTAFRYFLQHKNSGLMGKKGDMCVALNKLEDMHLIILQKGIDSHPDTTLNLLGHVYKRMGWNRLAVQCFRKSWQIMPHYNAVKWHVMFILFCNQSISEKKSLM